MTKKTEQDEINTPPSDEPVKKKAPAKKKTTAAEMKVAKSVRGRKYPAKTRYEDGQVPLHVCNQMARKVAEGLKQQKHEAFIRYAKKLIAAEEK